MRSKLSIIAIIASLGSIMPSAAMAGVCGASLAQMGPQCQAPIVTQNMPLDHLKQVQISPAPHINVARIYGQAQPINPGAATIAGVAPCGIASGGYGTAGMACGSMMKPMPMMKPAPMMPIASMLKPAPIVSAPVVSAPVMPAPIMTRPLTIKPAPIMPAVQPSSPTTTVITQTPISANGAYWQQVTGPAMVGGTMVSKIICKRPAPQIVHPVIRMPVPVKPVMTQGIYCQSQPAGHAPLVSPRYASKPYYGHK